MGREAGERRGDGGKREKEDRKTGGWKKKGGREGEIEGGTEKGKEDGKEGGR